MRMLTDVLDECQRENRRLEASLAALTEEREGLRADWREQDLILQKLALLAGDDERITDAGGVLVAVQEAFAALQQQLEVLKPGGSYAWKSKYEALTAAHDRVREALEQIAERDHVRDPNDRPPLVVALERWHDCVALAKVALTSPEGPPTGAVVNGANLTKGLWRVEVDSTGNVTNLRHLHDDNEPSRGAPYPNSSKANIT